MAKRKLTKDPTLQPRIQAALERGLTDEMACAEVGIHPDTFYEYIKTISDFSDMVTRAKSAALSKAVQAFASGLERTKTVSVKTTEFKETRIRRSKDKDGNVIEVPYTYSKVTENKEIAEAPPDWRAGEAWLKRRDAKNWSEKLQIEITLVEKFIQVTAALGVDPNDALKQFTEAMLSERAISSLDSGKDESTSSGL